MADLTEQQLGNYRLIRRLAEGGFAEVYLGKHLHLGTQAAVKVLHARLASPDEATGFKDEARIIAHLKHPHIVSVLDFDVQNSTPFLIMDYAAGGTLRKLYPKGCVLDISTVISYVKQIANALQYAHDQKLIHRDIKPENILLGERGEVLVSDFGLAIIAHSTKSWEIQNIAGTPFYMAPEQFQGKAEPASDQYSLGTLVYEWLCGERPFPTGDFIQLGYQHNHVPPPSLREKSPTISPDVEQVVMTALAKEPKKRFASVQAFAHALEQAAQSPISITQSPMPKSIQAPQEEIPSNPWESQRWLNNGLRHCATENNSEALAAFDRAIQYDPTNSYAFYCKGGALLRLERREEAIQAYDQAVQLDPSYVDALTNKGLVLFELQRYEEAILAYDHAIYLNQYNSLAYNNKGNALNELNRREEAVLAYDRATKHNPNYGSAFYNKALTLKKLGRYKEALVAYNRAIQLDPNNTAAYNNKGLVLIELNRHKEAIQAFDRATQLDPKHSIAFCNKGLALIELEKYEEALEVLDRAIWLDPNYMGAYCNKGNALESLGRYEEAIQAYNKAIQLDPTNSVLLFDKGIALVSLKRYEEAIQAYDQAIQLNPNYGYALINKGAALTELKRYEEALEVLDQAIQLNPNYSQAFSSKGSALNALGRDEEALKAFRKALELDPLNRIAKINKEKLEGKDKKGQGVFRRFLGD